MDFKTTPLFEVHKKLGAKTAPFGGYLMPIQYKGIIEEHNWTRTNCSIFDICHMGEFILQGDAKNSNLESIVTFSLESMPQGACRYGFMLNENGSIIDDLIVYRIDEEEWMLVVNAATESKDEAHIKKNLSWDAHFKNISSTIAKLDLQGPESGNVLSKIVGDKIKALKYYTFSDFLINGEEYLVSRTGYTGELGYEIYAGFGHVEKLWNMFLEDKRVQPAGLGARDTLRLEMGYSLYGQDIDETVSPLSLASSKFIDFDKDFIGKDALLEIKKSGIESKLICFKTISRRAP
ncbi:MAG: glycine cleavage system aminomethyltransferase GcvT, partial [Candidatus Omnitrophica bacterium]|nr:glycine cleavage system aminomethyltransferase GcvT [Candidatus Omnitrophota bacterium]